MSQLSTTMTNAGKMASSSALYAANFVYTIANHAAFLTKSLISILAIARLKMKENPLDALKIILTIASIPTIFTALLRIFQSQGKRERHIENHKEELVDPNIDHRKGLQMGSTLFPKSKWSVYRIVNAISILISFICNINLAGVFLSIMNLGYSWLPVHASVAFSNALSYIVLVNAVLSISGICALLSTKFEKLNIIKRAERRMGVDLVDEVDKKYITVSGTASLAAFTIALSWFAYSASSNARYLYDKGIFPACCNFINIVNMVVIAFTYGSIFFCRSKCKEANEAELVYIGDNSKTLLHKRSPAVEGAALSLSPSGWIKAFQAEWKIIKAKMATEDQSTDNYKKLAQDIEMLKYAIEYAKVHTTTTNSGKLLRITAQPKRQGGEESKLSTIYDTNPQEYINRLYVQMDSVSDEKQPILRAANFFARALYQHHLEEAAKTEVSKHFSSKETQIGIDKFKRKMENSSDLTKQYLKELATLKTKDENAKADKARLEKDLGDIETLVSKLDLTTTSDELTKLTKMIKHIQAATPLKIPAEKTADDFAKEIQAKNSSHIQEILKAAEDIKEYLLETDKAMELQTQIKCEEFRIKIIPDIISLITERESARRDMALEAENLNKKIETFLNQHLKDSPEVANVSDFESITPVIGAKLQILGGLAKGDETNELKRASEEAHKEAIKTEAERMEKMAQDLSEEVKKLEASQMSQVNEELSLPLTLMLDTVGLTNSPLNGLGKAQDLLGKLLNPNGLKAAEDKLKTQLEEYNGKREELEKAKQAQETSSVNAETHATNANNKIMQVEAECPSLTEDPAALIAAEIANIIKPRPDIEAARKRHAIAVKELEIEQLKLDTHNRTISHKKAGIEQQEIVKEFQKAVEEQFGCKCDEAKNGDGTENPDEKINPIIKALRNSENEAVSNALAKDNMETRLMTEKQQCTCQDKMEKVELDILMQEKAGKQPLVSFMFERFDTVTDMVNQPKLTV